MRPPRKKILFVDDDERTLNVVSRFLISKGYEVHATTSPFVAPLIEKEKPDLVVLDVNMPLLPGDRIAEILDRQGYASAIPLLFFSGEPPERIERIAERFPRANWVSKSSGLEHLTMKIREMLA